MEEKLVSIITPCYNGELYLERFFDNILEQTYDNIELIFINDGSMDKTEQIAMSYKQKIESKKQSFVYIFQENAGQAAAVNKGIKIFNGEYLIWTDADDILDKDNVKRKVEFMEENPQHGFAQCYGKEVLENDLSKKTRDFRRVPPIGKDNFFEDLIMKRNVEYTPGLYIVRRNAFLTANPERDIFISRVGQNIQMLLPVAYRFSCGYIKEDLFTYVIRKQSYSRDGTNIKNFTVHSIEYKKLLLATLERIEMTVPERKYYTARIEQFILKLQFNAGYALKDKELLETKYKELKEKKYLTLRDIIVYYAYSYKVVTWMFLVLESLKRKIKNVIKL